MTTPQDNTRIAVLTPKLRRVLFVVLAGFGLLSIDSIYLLAVRIAGDLTRTPQDTLLTIWAFLLHVVLGLALIVPVILYGFGHMRRARHSPNLNARRVGYVLFLTSIVLLVTGVLLLRVEAIPNPFDSGDARDIAWWTHTLAPLVVVWLFIAHRMVGPFLHWRVGIRWCVVGVVVLGVAGLTHLDWTAQEDQARQLGAPASMARLAGPEFLSVESLTAMDDCVTCHQDVHTTWATSAHRFASFDNPVYAAAVRQTRKVNFDSATFCAACHDPVLLASNTFSNQNLDDPTFDLARIPGATAGVNCLVCHSITDADPFGNGSWVLSEPRRYPFSNSENGALRWINRQLIRSRPGFHKRSMFKPGLTDSALLCGTCHKATIPEGLNHYRWLAGQNHYDSWRLSGVSGHGLSSWRWPKKPSSSCNDCHMQLIDSTGMAARDRDASGRDTVHDHRFASGNSALAVLLDLQPREELLAAQRKMLESSLRVDIVGLREDAKIDGAFIGPLRPSVPTLQPGARYLVEVVCRNTSTGHAFTQGTADSNEIWIEFVAKSSGAVIGASGIINGEGVVDPWAYRLNAFVVDAQGEHVQNRAPEVIFASVYNHQIPPGAASVTHYDLEIPANATGLIELEVRVKYRKFSRALMDVVYGKLAGERVVKTLPSIVVSSDRVVFGVQGYTPSIAPQFAGAESWERLYDYGIALFRAGQSGGLKAPMKQALEAFDAVEALGRSEGPFGLTKVFVREGRWDEAVAALARASVTGTTIRPWGLTWWAGLIDLERGALRSAREKFQALAEQQDVAFPGTRAIGFDFSGDDELLLNLAEIELRLAREDNTSAGFSVALSWSDAVIERNPQNQRAWWLRAQALEALGRSADAALAREEHERFRPDEQAQESAVHAARARYPWADHAAEPSAKYSLSHESQKPND